MTNYIYPKFDYLRSKAQAQGIVERHPIVVIGAGPIGLTAALDCAARGQPVVVLDDNDTVSIGSRAVCYAKRPLEIWSRLHCADPIVERGVSWNVGKVFFRDELCYRFDLLPETGHQWPAMINLQQYHLEEILIAKCRANPLIELRWKHRLIGLKQAPDHAELAVETPDGIFNMEAQWVIACDGANSDTRKMVGAEFEGQYFEDRFLIADVAMTADFPTERWFWFDPPFHPGQSVLLHRQADDLWRIDFQLGWDANPDEERKPERVIPRIKAMLGEDAEFELEWVSIYQFACRRIDKFRHGRVLFAGDAAHQVSPFGARGANTGVQDIDNLAWKLAMVLRGEAPDALIDSYHAERAYAADDNILNSTRATDFITPKNKVSRLFRDAALELARQHGFARPLVNSGRLSTPTPYVGSPLNTPSDSLLDGEMRPGVNAADAPVTIDGNSGWFLNCLGAGFVVVTFDQAVGKERIKVGPIEARVIRVGRDIDDPTGIFASRYAASTDVTYLFRPDQYIAARWAGFDQGKISEALLRATAHDARDRKELAA